MMSLPAATTDPSFDGPLGAPVACDIDRQLQGLTKTQALKYLMIIIETEPDGISETEVRIAYAYNKILVDKLWENCFGSVNEWLSSIGRQDVDNIKQRAISTLERIRTAASTVKNKWALDLEVFAGKPSKDLAITLASLASICPDPKVARGRIEACRRRRHLAEPGPRGRGVPRTEKLLPIDVRTAQREHEAELSTKRPSPSVSPPHPSTSARSKRPRLSRKDNPYNPSHPTALSTTSCHQFQATHLNQLNDTSPSKARGSGDDFEHTLSSQHSRPGRARPVTPTILTERVQAPIRTLGSLSDLLFGHSTRGQEKQTRLEPEDHNNQFHELSGLSDNDTTPSQVVKSEVTSLEYGRGNSHHDHQFHELSGLLDNDTSEASDFSLCRPPRNHLSSRSDKNDDGSPTKDTVSQDPIDSLQESLSFKSGSPSQEVDNNSANDHTHSLAADDDRGPTHFSILDLDASQKDYQSSIEGEQISNHNDPATLLRPGKYATRYDETIRDFDDQIHNMLKVQTKVRSLELSVRTQEATLARASRLEWQAILLKAHGWEENIERARRDAAEAVRTAEESQCDHLRLRTDLLCLRHGPSTQYFLVDTLVRLELTIAENAKMTTEKYWILGTITEEQYAASYNSEVVLDQLQTARVIEDIAVIAENTAANALQSWLRYMRESHPAYTNTE